MRLDGTKSTPANVLIDDDVYIFLYIVYRYSLRPLIYLYIELVAGASPTLFIYCFRVRY